MSGPQQLEVRGDARAALVYNGRMSSEQTIYELAGGEPAFRRLVDAFYARVEQDPLLRPMFPADLEPGKASQRLFLIQYFGGPNTYSQQRGHPRLRMRHAPFPIGQAARDAWLAHMLAALDEAAIPEPARGPMRDYFAMAATAMINQQPPITIGGPGEGRR
jgi:hemoglobin